MASVQAKPGSNAWKAISDIADIYGSSPGSIVTLDNIKGNSNIVRLSDDSLEGLYMTRWKKIKRSSM